MVKFYSSPDGLKANVLTSLDNLKKSLNTGGWIRAEEAEKLVRNKPPDKFQDAHNELEKQIASCRVE